MDAAAGAPQQFGSGWNALGAAILSSKSSLAAAKIHEFTTLQAPSPMKVTTLPVIGPASLET